MAASVTVYLVDHIAFVNSSVIAIKLAEESLGVQCDFTLFFVLCCAWGMLIAMLLLLAGKNRGFPWGTNSPELLRGCLDSPTLGR